MLQAACESLAQARSPHTPASGIARCHRAPSTPAILDLLSDGTPRSKSTIIAALANGYPREDVVRTLMRLAVTGQLVEIERKYSLAPAAETGEGAD